MSNKVEEKSIVLADQLALVPTLRFPEFRDAGEWVETPLKVIADPVSERATQDVENNILSLSGEDGLVLQREYFGKKVAGENSERYLKIVRDDFVYNDRTTKASTYGTIKRLTKYSGGIVSPIYKCFRFNADENPVFWEWYFESGIHDKQLRSLVNEGARAGRFNISISQFLSTAAWRPNEDEQQKIADCLASIDELLTMEGQKLAALKAHKKGLMQQLFPAQGETLPTLRFPEFRDADVWINKQLCKVADVNASGDLDSEYFSPTKTDQHIYPIYSNSVTQEGLYGYCTYPKYKKDSVTITARGTLGVAFCRDHDYVGIGRLLILSNLKNVIPYFLQEIWNYSAKMPLENGGIPQLTAIKARAVELYLPEKEEQQKIADFLSSIDELITAQTQKLSTLKAHKKGLMQQLFPALDEVQR